MQRSGVLCLLAIGVLTTAGAEVRWADINRQPAAWYAGSAARAGYDYLGDCQPSCWPRIIRMQQLR